MSDKNLLESSKEVISELKKEHPELKQIPPEGQAIVGKIVAQFSAGPLPPATELARYKQIDSSIPGRLLTLVEKEQEARRALERALELDPVEEKTYAYLASIALLQQKPQLAQHWIDTYRRGPDGVTEPDFLARHRQLSPFFGALEQQTNALLREQGVK